jgi:hypothetical protein
MTPTTLIDAHEHFAHKLDELRCSFVADFAAWLKGAFADGARTGTIEATERITAIRGRFVQEFIDEAAPALIRSLNRDAERDILDALRSYEAHFAPRATQATPTTADFHPWQPSLWRTAIGAAFGAVIGVVLLALGEISTTPPTATTTAGSGSPAMWLFDAFAAALGAAVGAILVACPPVEVLLRRRRLSGGLLSLVRRFATLGGVLLLLRGNAVIALAAVILSAIFGVAAWFLKDAKLSQIVLVFLALATILAARWTAPGKSAADTDALARGLLDRLDRELRSDAEVLAALAAALVVKRVHGAPAPSPLQEITNIIISRRQQNEPGEAILRIVEQNLRLRPESKQPPQGPAEFDWERRHEEVFSTYGAVEIGDRVRVLQWPLFIEGPGGRKSVSQKGLVAPVL